MDCTLPGSSFHGVFQARVQEWVAISFSRGYSWPMDQTWVSHIAGKCLTIWATRETGKVVWYSHLFNDFPQFVVIYNVKGFSVVNEGEVYIFLAFPSFFVIQQMLAIWSLVPLPFPNPAWTSGSSQFTYHCSLAWRILSITLLACKMSPVVW